MVAHILPCGNAAFAAVESEILEEQIQAYNQARAINHRPLLPGMLQGFGRVVQFVHDIDLFHNRRKEACASQAPRI
jgi:hypothetical protein